MFPRRPPTDEVVSIFDALVARKGQTTAPGAAGGTSIIDSGLIGAGANSFAEHGRGPLSRRTITSGCQNGWRLQ